MKALVLLSSYNGEKYIEEQIESILNQELNSDIKLEILIRDDGSKNPEMTNILKKYDTYENITVIFGENFGPSRSFWELIQIASLEYDYYLFADQDDVWKKNKIKKGVDFLETKVKSKPLLYFSRVDIVDSNLNYIGKNGNGKLSLYTDFAHSLFFSTAPGCTFIFNNTSIQILKKYVMTEKNQHIHDWLVHKIISIFGEVYLDEETTMLYRQHGNNVIGANNDNIFKKIMRLKNNKNIRSIAAKNILDAYEKDLPQDKKKMLELLAFYREKKTLKKRLLRDKTYKTNSYYDCIIKMLIMMGKI